VERLIKERYHVTAKNFGRCSGSNYREREGPEKIFTVTRSAIGRAETVSRSKATPKIDWLKNEKQ
jgi:hypothetical protein